MRGSFLLVRQLVGERRGAGLTFHHQGSKNGGISPVRTSRNHPKPVGRMNEAPSATSPEQHHSDADSFALCIRRFTVYPTWGVAIKTTVTA